MFNIFVSDCTGFNTYMAMLKIDIYHNHPILKAFVEILTDAAAERKQICGIDLEKGRIFFLILIFAKWLIYITINSQLL